ncbi:hypothetical protein [Streptococcus thoraltensis]|nr:hypothetical protein [Streptococcus thoraltensis]MDY4762231.1 hypothetical protein [Streptococcus thoraltensis]
MNTKIVEQFEMMDEMVLSSVEGGIQVPWYDYMIFPRDISSAPWNK